MALAYIHMLCLIPYVVPIITMNIVPCIPIISHICVGAQFITPAPYHRVSFPTQKKTGSIHQPYGWWHRLTFTHRNESRTLLTPIAISNTVPYVTIITMNITLHVPYNTVPYVPIISCIGPHNTAHFRRGVIHYARPIPQEYSFQHTKTGSINRTPTDGGTGLHSHAVPNIIHCITSPLRCQIPCVTSLLLR
jgi:hypothetical protein